MPIMYQLGLLYFFTRQSDRPKAEIKEIFDTIFWPFKSNHAMLLANRLLEISEASLMMKGLTDGKSPDNILLSTAKKLIKTETSRSHVLFHSGDADSEFNVSSCLVSIMTLVNLQKTLGIFVCYFLPRVRMIIHSQLKDEPSDCDFARKRWDVMHVLIFLVLRRCEISCFSDLQRIANDNDEKSTEEQLDRSRAFMLALVATPWTACRYLDESKLVSYPTIILRSGQT